MNPEFAGSQYVIEVIYLIASALFILSLKWMSSPATARHGILAGEIGMVLAIGGTLLRHGIIDWKWIIIALVLGSGIGIPLGMVQMTAVPQRTALSHAFGAVFDNPGRHSGILFAIPGRAEIHDVGAVMETFRWADFTGASMAARSCGKSFPTAYHL
jgi:hypothetical protein